MTENLQVLFRPLQDGNDINEFEKTEERTSDEPWDRFKLTKALENSPGLNIRLLQTSVHSNYKDAVPILTVGHSIWQVFEKSISLLNIAVRPGLQRQGYGHYMIDYLLRIHNKDIDVIVNEENTGALLFLSDLNFKAENVLRDLFDDRDGIEMVYHTSG
tara:strand:- start:782 stop:1258 length:477 start_codon:yes stop_codon:yes gene_type:complete